MTIEEFELKYHTKLEFLRSEPGRYYPVLLDKEVGMLARFRKNHIEYESALGDNILSQEYVSDFKEVAKQSKRPV